MNNEMSNQDEVDTAYALGRWFESQDIEPDQAIAVMARALIACIEMQAYKCGRDARKGAQIIAKLILDNVEDQGAASPSAEQDRN